MNIIQKIGLVSLFGITFAACVPMSTCQSIVKSDKDQAGSGKSTCTGDCAINWPPLLVDKNATSYGDYSIITRDDGKQQFAYKGKPLYFFIMDKKPDDRNGDNYSNGTWHLVKM